MEIGPLTKAIWLSENRASKEEKDAYITGAVVGEQPWIRVFRTVLVWRFEDNHWMCRNSQTTPYFTKIIHFLIVTKGLVNNLNLKYMTNLKLWAVFCSTYLRLFLPNLLLSTINRATLLFQFDTVARVLYPALSIEWSRLDCCSIGSVVKHNRTRTFRSVRLWNSIEPIVAISSILFCRKTKRIQFQLNRKDIPLVCIWSSLKTKIFQLIWNDLKSINSILGNMQAQAPVHVANVQVGRGHRQLLQSWISSFLLNNKLFNDTDGESGHSR